MAHPPRIPVWLRWDQRVIYFLTFCVARRECVLNNGATFAALQSAVARLTKWRVIAGVVMPDHVHLLISPNEREATVGNATAAIKRWMRQELDADWKWQPGSFDHLLRSDESAQENGNIFARTQCGLDTWRNGPIGPTASALNCRAGAPPAQVSY